MICKPGLIYLEQLKGPLNMTIKKVKQLIFDADDTLWENNIFYIRAAEDLVGLLVQNGSKRRDLEQAFQQLEKRVVKERGYGSANYIYILRTLFERYLHPPADPLVMQNFENICTDFLSHVRTAPQIFPQVTDVLEKLRYRYRLFVLTKGNIAEQWKKLERSNLLTYFEKAYVETEKNLSTYQRLLRENNWLAAETCMIGNSPKSDINPALKAGCWAVFIPYAFTWVLDDEQLSGMQNKLKTVSSFSDLELLFL
jgi:putative hydrolase of the HAD superfamily